MKLHCKAKPWGELRLFEMTEIDAALIKDGRTVFEDFIPNGRLIMHDKNVITDGGDQRIAELVGGLSTNFVVDIGIGDEGVSPGDPAVPLAPTKTDTTLVHLIRQKAITSANLVTTPDFQIQFSEVFFTNDPSNAAFTGASVINEAGLFTADAILFARKTFVPIPFAIIDRVGIIASWSIHVL